MANLATISNNILADSGIDSISVVTGSGTANQIAYWSSGSAIGSLTTATYPSLTELSYVKGVTSSIQTQIDAKAPNVGSFSDANALTNGGFFAAYNPTNIPAGQTGGDWGLLNTPMWTSNSGTERYTFQLASNLDNNANIFIRKFRYNGSVLQSTWYTLLNSGNYSAYALPLTGGTLSGQLNVTYTDARVIIGDGTSGMSLGLWDTVNNRIETSNKPLYIVSYGGTISLGRSGGNNLVIDTSSVTFGSSSFTAAGNINGVGANISGVSALAGVVKHTGYPYKVYENLCAIDNYYGSAGAFAITTSIPWTAGNMLTIEVKGYDYNGGRNFTATFNCYAGESNFYSTGYTTNADDLFSKTYNFYRNASNNVVLVLGSTGGNYQYQLWVSEFKQGYSSLTSSYADGWTISPITSTTGLSNGTSISNKTYTGGIFNGSSVTGTSAYFSSTLAAASGSTFTGTGTGVLSSILKLVNTTSADSTIEFSNTANGFTFGFASTGVKGQRFTFINGAPTEIAYITSAGAAVFSSSVTGSSIIKTGGTSSQYLMADGSVSTLTNPVTGTGVTNRLAYWSGTSTIGYLDTASYPSLTEISYVKGVTSAIQTQIDAKQATLTLTTTGTSGASTLVGATLNIPQYQSVLTNPVTGTGVTNRITYWDSASSISYLDTSTYPSLTELSYVKGVTSGIQNQLNNRVLKNDTNLTDANASGVTISGGFYTGFNPTNVPAGLSSLDIGLFNFPMWTGNNTNERYSVQMLANFDSNANIYIRKFKYFNAVNLSTWYVLLNSGNYSSYALPLSGGTVTGDTTFSGAGRRISISDGTNGMTLGLWDGANCRIETAGRPLYMVSYGGKISIGRSGYNNLDVDTTTTSFGSSSMSSAGVFTGTGLDISNNSLLNKVKYTQYGYRVYRNLARFDNYGNGTGAIAIYTTIPWTAANMLTIQVKGYTYGGNGPFDITFSCYAGEGNFFSPGYFTNSENTFAGNYTWYRDTNTNYVVLVLGTTGGSYGCQVWVSEYKQGFGGQDPAYADGWSISKITSIPANFANAVSIPVKTNTYGAVNASSLVVTNTGIDVFGSQMKVVNSTSSPALITFQNTANGFAFGFNSTTTQRFIWYNGAPTEIASLNASGHFSASAYFESSDARLKNIYKTHDSLEFGAIEYSWISDESKKIRWGYLAQDVQKWLPDAIGENGEGYLTVDYTQAHTYKIAMLEKRVAELEQQLKNK